MSLRSRAARRPRIAGVFLLVALAMLGPARAASLSPLPSAVPAIPRLDDRPIGPAAEKRTIFRLRVHGAPFTPYRLSLPAGFLPGTHPMVVLLDNHASSHRYLVPLDEATRRGRWIVIAPDIELALVEAPGGAIAAIVADVRTRFGVAGGPLVLAGFGGAASRAYALALGETGGFTGVLADAGIMDGGPPMAAAMFDAKLAKICLLAGDEDITTKPESRERDLASLTRTGLAVRVFPHDGRHLIAPPAAYAAALEWMAAP